VSGLWLATVGEVLPHCRPILFLQCWQQFKDGYNSFLCRTELRNHVTDYSGVEVANVKFPVMGLNLLEKTFGLNL
jgi:hypothetical protein